MATKNNFNLFEMENIFEIGRTIEALDHNGQIDLTNFDSKDIFAFALELAQRFEKEYPNTDDYYYDLDEFVNEKIRKEFGEEKYTV